MGIKNSVWENKERVAEAFDSACSIKDILVALGEPLGSANYRAAKVYAERYNLELPKFSNKNRTVAATFAIKIPLEDILVENSTYTNRQSLKKRLIKELGWEDRCGVPGCPNPDPVWNGKPITLQLDHINGVGNDNRIENLMIICPNCHTQTPTFANRNKHRYENGSHGYCENGHKSKNKKCLRCEESKLNTKAKKPRPSKISWPNPEEVLSAVKEESYSAVGRDLGVSDNAVRKFLLKHGMI